MSKEITLVMNELCLEVMSGDNHYKRIFYVDNNEVQVTVEILKGSKFFLYQVVLLNANTEDISLKTDVEKYLDEAVGNIVSYLGDKGYTVNCAV